MKNKQIFNGLLKSEIKKAEKLANTMTKSKDCKVTGYYWDGTYEEWFDMKFINVCCEICHNYKNRAKFDICLHINLSDRRKTYAHSHYRTTDPQYII